MDLSICQSYSAFQAVFVHLRKQIKRLKMMNVTSSKRLEGKVAIITGGASGIGEATVRLFVQEGAKVVIADVQDNLGTSLCEDIIKNNKESEGSISYIHCDVSSDSQVKNLVDAAVEKYGKLDIMFSNAGIPGRADSTISGVEYQDFKKVFDVNVFGCLATAKHAARVMVPQKKGSIIFTSSVASVTYGDVPHVYSASKHAIVGLAKNLCVELGKHGIRVNCVSPFGVITPMLSKGLGMEKEHLEEFVSEIANLKHAKVEAGDVADAALYLASDQSKYVSGLNLVIDGGYSTTNIALSEALKRSQA